MRRVAVVGLGLIGGSAALALGARGYDRDWEVRDRARSLGIDAAETLADAVSEADIVLTAVSTAETPELLREISAVAPAAVLTDTASMKMPTVLAAQQLRAGVRLVAGHPMAGSERAGIGAASAELFRGRPWVLVRTAKSDDAAMADVSELVRRCGARPVAMDGERHDRLMTWISHLPLAVAAALCRTVEAKTGTELAEVAGPGYLGTTRAAAQPSPLALELVMADPAALAAAIDVVRGELATLSAALRAGDAEGARDFLESAGRARRQLDPEASRPPK